MNNFEKRPKEGYGFIYKYTSPSGKSYIGQTIRSLKERAVSSNGIGYKGSKVFYAAIQKYGFENFTYEILGECPIKDLDWWETFLIQKENTLIPNGYNIQEGGSQSYKKNFSSCKRAINMFDLQGKFIKSFDSIKDAAREINTDYQSIVAVLVRNRPQHRGYIFRYIEEPNPEPVIVKKTHGRLTGQYDLEDNLLKVYPSANQAALGIGKNSNAGRNIRMVCEGKRQTAYGFKWKFLD